MRKSYTILVDKRKEKEQIGKPTSISKENIKKELIEVGLKDVN
jgi:hypothetical protein